jgi:hypothetical protein
MSGGAVAGYSIRFHSAAGAQWMAANEERGTMAQYEAHGTSRSGDVLDTIAFGSMLVFASVMPPFGSDTAETISRRVRQRADGAGGAARMEPASGEGAVGRVRRRFDS